MENGRLYVQPEGGEKEEQSALERPYLARIPVVVLVNRHTYNSAEMLAYFLQAAGRAKVVGEPTAGALGMSGSAEGPLINGDFIAVSSLRMRNLDGSPFPSKSAPMCWWRTTSRPLLLGVIRCWNAPWKCCDR